MSISGNFPLLFSKMNLTLRKVIVETVAYSVESKRRHRVPKM